MLIVQCDSLPELEEIQQTLQSSIDKLRTRFGPEPRAGLLPIGALIRKHKMSPQKTSASKLLALAKRSKKKRGLSTPEKLANIRVQEKLEQLNCVVPLCFVCEKEYDLHNILAEKCSKCDRWCHMSCRHVCII